MRNSFLPYDRFKLFVLVIILIMLYAAGVIIISMDPFQIPIEATHADSTEPVTRTSEPTIELILPALPSGSDQLKFDAQNTSLFDDNGDKIYALSDDGSTWSPVIPPDVFNLLPADHELRMDENGMWQILDADGSAWFVFSFQDQQWSELEKDGIIAVIENEKPIPDMDCPDANPGRIAGPGEMVRVANASIPLRSSPSAISNNHILTLTPGDFLEVIGWAICTPYLEGANLWWPVRTMDGEEGYAAESSAVSSLYYLHPLQ